MKNDKPKRDKYKNQLVEQKIDIITPDRLEEVPFLSDIGLATTFHCQASCPHCIVEAGPKRKEYIPLNNARFWLDQIAHYNYGQIKAIALTGGEPFSNIDHLTEISKKAGSLGLLVTAVTNAYWATSEEIALRVLERLPDIALLTFSTDIYHQRAISVKHVKNAFIAAQALKRRCNIAVCTGTFIDDATQKILDYLDEFAPPNTINMARIFPVGRARGFCNDIQYPTSLKPPKTACNMAHAPVILPDGRIIACFGPIIEIKSSHPLLLGNLYEEDLSDILNRAEMNSILHAIRVWGPYELVDIIKDKGLDDYLPIRYVKDSICCTCYDLLNNQNLKAFFDDLKQDKEFQTKVSYGRAYYLKEQRMMELLNSS